MDEKKKPITKQDLQAAILKETLALIEENREVITERAMKRLKEERGS
jgi:hypothetical protein